jgi:hypothetical protein
MMMITGSTTQAASTVHPDNISIAAQRLGPVLTCCQAGEVPEAQRRVPAG